MQRAFTYIIILALSAITAPVSWAQEEGDEGKFHLQVDSIVNDVLQKFDNELGTYIFRDEPYDNDDSGRAEVDQSVPDISQSYPKTTSYHGNQLSPLTSHRSIMRNSFPAFPWENVDEHVLFRYNRVEGLFLGLNYPQKYYWNDQKLSLFASGGYGFAAHRWRGGIGGAHQFGFENNIIEIGAEVHSLTDSRDQWIIGVGENNLAALLLRDDYRDYFEREGFSVWTGLYKRWRISDLQIQIGYLNDQYTSLSRSTNWSIFGTDKTFRENPPVDEGRSRSILATVKFHSTQARRIFTSGWSLSAGAEIAGKSLGGVFDFNSYVIDVRRYQPLSRYGNFNLRLRAASATGDVPYQKAFDLGGFGTLPAFGFKEFFGNRMLLANAEYIINGKMLDDVEFFPSWLLGNLNLFIFADAGYVAVADRKDFFLKGFNDISSSTVRSDWGVGIGSRDAKLRLGFAWRTDKAEPVKIFLRLNRPF
jgi:hypothetical protein